MDSFSADVNVYMQSQKRPLSHAMSLAVNYRFFSHRDVSYRFNGKNDNVLFEFWISSFRPLMVASDL